MLIKATKGRDPLGLCQYLLDPAKQVEGARSPILATNMAGSSAAELAEEFRFIHALNPRVKNAVCHFSISLPPHEKVEREVMQAVSLSFLEQMGHGRCPFFAVQHHDRELVNDVLHWHVASSAVDLTGRWVDDAFNFSRIASITRQLESDFGCLKCLPKQPLKQRNLSSGEHRLKARTGKLLHKEKLWAALEAAAQGARTMPELVECLMNDGVKIHLKSVDHEVKGICFELDGLVFAGRQLGKTFSFFGLQFHGGISYLPERDNQSLDTLVNGLSLLDKLAFSINRLDEMVTQAAQLNSKFNPIDESFDEQHPKREQGNFNNTQPEKKNLNWER